MGETKETILDFMGYTPIIKLQNIVPNGFANVYVKLEEFNPGGSVKSRIALQMVLDAENKGVLKPHSGQVLIEPTGGNTGIGLAIVGAVRGYRVILVVPNNYSKEKINILKAYGAEVLLSDSTKGNDSHVQRVREIVSKHSDYIWLDQLSNQSNPRAHYENTGKEILMALNRVDCFVAGMGSGGTITGVSKRIKEKFPEVMIVGVQPFGCDSLKGVAIPHKIQGFSIGIVPDVLNVSLIDKMLSIKYEEAIQYMKLLSTKEGVLVGISSGANVCAAIKMAGEFSKEKTIATIAPDSGRSYLDVFD